MQDCIAYMASLNMYKSVHAYVHVVDMYDWFVFLQNTSFYLYVLVISVSMAHDVLYMYMTYAAQVFISIYTSLP